MNPEETSRYDEIQQSSRAALRRAVLDAATRLLVTDGIRGLSMRRIAGEVGCSTMVLYTLFGNKQGLVDALWVEGFTRLWQAEQTVSTALDPLPRLGALGRAYHQLALANPDYYRMMFGGAIPGFTPSEHALTQSRHAFQVLVDAVSDCIAAGIFRPEDPVMVAEVLWATVHGVVSLHLAGNFDETHASALLERAMRAIAAGFFAQPAPHE